MIPRTCADCVTPGCVVRGHTAAAQCPSFAAGDATIATFRESVAQLERASGGFLTVDAARGRIHAAALLCLLGEPHAALALLFPRDTGPRMMPDLRRVLASHIWRIETGKEALP